jgi:very-short-patch-repair endonuclease
MTVAERRVWQILRLHQMKGYKFRRQVPIGRYIADFVCHGARLIVEIDGGQHDRSSSEERSRTHFLKGQGYRVLRFWNNEVLENPDGVYKTIVDELGRITPSPPSPIKGEDC